MSVCTEISQAVGVHRGTKQFLSHAGWTC